MRLSSAVSVFKSRSRHYPRHEFVGESISVDSAFTEVSTSWAYISHKLHCSPVTDISFSTAVENMSEDNIIAILTAAPGKFGRVFPHSQIWGMRSTNAYKAEEPFKGIMEEVERNEPGCL